MTLLVIRLMAGRGAPARWLRLSDDGAPLDFGEIARPFAGQLAGIDAGRVILVAPGEDVVGHSLHLPAAGEAQTRAAARFAIEDDLAVEIAGVHIAVAPPSASGSPRLVAVVARAAVEGWITDALALGRPADAILPEWACLPGAAGECAALVEDGVAHVNFTGAVSAQIWGFSAETDLAALLAGPALDRFDCRRITIWGDPAQIAPAAGWANREIAAHAAPDARAALALLGRGGAASSFTLLQGEYAPRRALAIDFRLWRRAAILLAAVFGAWIALTLAEASALDRRAGALRAEAEATFAQAFPDEPRIVNPRLQMQTRLAALRGQGGGAFLDLAALIAGAADAQPGVEISAIRYARASAALTAELVMADYESLQALRAAVAAQGGALEEGASRQEAGRVVGDVTVRLP